MDKKLVSGPVNAFRLEGSVNGVQKIIYLFGDFHLDVTDEKPCSDPMSEDFKRYFVKNIKRAKEHNNITYDFFMEQNYMDKGYDIIHRQKYIWEMRKYFEKNVNIIDEKDKKPRNIGTKEDVNLRLHYGDIRYNIIKNLIIKIYDILNITEHPEYLYKSPSAMASLRTLINYHKNAILFITDTFDLSKELSINEMQNEETQNFNNKIRNKYDNENIKTAIFSYIFKNLNNQKKEAYEYIAKLESCLRDLEKCSLDPNNLKLNQYNKYEYGDHDKLYITTTYIINYGNHLFSILHSMIGWFMDIYFLRRLLDKSYINHMIAYTGMLHTYRYIHFLINNFDFNITHASYPKIAIKKLNKYLKKMSYSDNIDPNIYPPQLIQCSDMTNFPKYFE